MSGTCSSMLPLKVSTSMVWLAAHDFSRMVTDPLNVCARTEPVTSVSTSGDENPWTVCDPSTPVDAHRGAEYRHVELGAARHLDVEVGLDHVVAAGERPPRTVALVGVDHDHVGAGGVDVELDPFQLRSRGAADRVDHDLGPIGRGDGDAPGEILEAQRPARLQLDGARDVFGFVKEPAGAA